MIDFKPAPMKAPARAYAPSMGATATLIPPPPPDFMFTGYPGAFGVLETVAVLTVTAAAAWAGIRTGMGQGGKYLRAAGWVGGVGSAVLGLLYVGAKSGLGSQVGLPAVRVTPS